MTRRQVSGFEEIRELGRGAQGRVELARHAERGTPVAIKYLPAGADPDARERFRHEAVMLGRGAWAATRRPPPRRNTPPW